MLSPAVVHLAVLLSLGLMVWKWEPEQVVVMTLVNSDAPEISEEILLAETKLPQGPNMLETLMSVPILNDRPAAFLSHATGPVVHE